MYLGQYRAAIFVTVVEFDAFTEGNDPHDEDHPARSDFGSARQQTRPILVFGVGLEPRKRQGPSFMTASKSPLSFPPRCRERRGRHLRGGREFACDRQVVADEESPALRDPRYPNPPFKWQSQSWPGLARRMTPRPDHGETSYRGSGRLGRRGGPAPFELASPERCLECSIEQIEGANRWT